MLTVHLFGKPETHIGNEAPIVFPTAQAEAIFYYLVWAKQPILHTKIASIFWPKMSDADARAEWQQLLPLLQHATHNLLRISAKQAAFNRQSEYWVDIYELELFFNVPTLSKRHKFEKLTTLYRGTFLDGLEKVGGAEFSRWQTQCQRSFEERVAGILQELAENCLQTRDFVLGFQITHWWLILQPGNELAHRLRMLLFWHNKQRTAALLQYNICSEYLQLHHRQEPSEATRQLCLQIQKDDMRFASNKVSMPIAEQTQRKHNLLKKLTSFVGREKEIATALNYLLEQKYPIIFILGEGGVGKTRLALTIGDALVKDPTALYYENGVWFVSCAGIDAHSAAQQLVINIGSVLGLQFQGSTPLLEQLTDYLSDKSLLLIIDNVEHLAGSLDLLLSLQRQNSHLQILVTSRHQLDIPNQVSLRLDGLQIPPFAQYDPDRRLTEEELAQLLNSESVQVLSQRTKRSLPGFLIDGSNGVVAARLCKLLNGNPLALELAATLIADYELATIYSELSHNFTLLSSELQDLPQRQRSIYNTIDYSWRMLPTPLATLLAHCSLFRGTFTFTAATTISGFSAQEIKQLVDRSLLFQVEQQRLSIHEMVRQFAAQKLEKDHTFALTTSRQHCEYYIERLCNWWDNSESKHVVAWLMPDFDNICAAWEWAFNHHLFTLLSRAIIPFTKFYIYAGLRWEGDLLIGSYYEKLRSQSHEVSKTGTSEAYQELMTALTYARALFYYQFSHHEQSLQLFMLAKAQVQQNGYSYLASNIEYYLGSLNRMAQRFQEAERYFKQAVAYAKAQKQPYAEIAALLSLGLIVNKLGRQQEGANTLQKARDLLHEYPDIYLSATYYGHYGETCHAQGYFSEALANYQKTIEIMAQQRSPTHHYHIIGKLLWQSGRFELAKEYLERVNTSNQNDYCRPGSFWHTILLIEFANLYVAWESPEQALFYSQVAEVQAKKLGFSILLARAINAKGAAQRQLALWEPAKDNLTHALRLFREESAPAFECNTLTQLVQLHLSLEEIAEIQTYSEALWLLLHSDTLDGTNAELIKAWWVCYRTFQSLHNARAEIALQRASELLQSQLDHIHDEAWKNDFVTQIVEHRMLRSAQAAYRQADRQAI